MENALLILIGIIAIGFIWLLWLRQVLLYHFRDVNNHLKLLQWDLWKRRDMVPYLLESFRNEESLKVQWQSLLEGRKHFHGITTLDDEWAYEKELLDFIRYAKVKNLNFLEAKKDIEDLSEIIQNERKEFDAAKEKFFKLRSNFPYFIASGMFGFQKIEL